MYSTNICAGTKTQRRNSPFKFCRHLDSARQSFERLSVSSSLPATVHRKTIWSRNSSTNNPTQTSLLTAVWCDSLSMVVVVTSNTWLSTSCRKQMQDRICAIKCYPKLPYSKRQDIQHKFQCMPNKDFAQKRSVQHLLRAALKPEAPGNLFARRVKLAQVTPPTPPPTPPLHSGCVVLTRFVPVPRFLSS